MSGKWVKASITSTYLLPIPSQTLNQIAITGFLSMNLSLHAQHTRCCYCNLDTSTFNNSMNMADEHSHPPQSPCLPPLLSMPTQPDFLDSHQARITQPWKPSRIMPISYQSTTPFLSFVFSDGQQSPERLAGYWFCVRVATSPLACIAAARIHKRKRQKRFSSQQARIPT